MVTFLPFIDLKRVSLRQTGLRQGWISAILGSVFVSASEARVSLRKSSQSFINLFEFCSVSFCYMYDLLIPEVEWHRILIRLLIGG